MDLIEYLLPHAWVCRRQFLLVENIQGRVAVEANVLSIGRDLVARQYPGIVGIIAKALPILGDVVPARHSSRGRGRLPPRKEGAKERAGGIVLDVELDTNISQVALNDCFNISAPWIEFWCRRVLELQARKQEQRKSRSKSAHMAQRLLTSSGESTGRGRPQGSSSASAI